MIAKNFIFYLMLATIQCTKKETETAPSTVHCNEDKITIEISEKIVLKKAKDYLTNVGNLKYQAVYLSPDGRLCSNCTVIQVRLTARGNRAFRLSIPHPFVDCGTTSFVTNDVSSSKNRNISFINYVWWIPNYIKQETLPVQLLTVRCIFNETVFLSSITPWCCNFESHVTRRGPIALEIQLWKSLPQNDVMSRPLQPPLYYLVGQTIYVTVSLAGKVNLKGVGNKLNLTLNECYIADDYNMDETTNAIKLLLNGHAPMNNKFDVKLFPEKTTNQQTFRLTIPMNLSISHFYFHCKGRCTEKIYRNSISTRFVSSNNNSDLCKESFVLSATTGPVFVKKRFTKRTRNKLESQRTLPNTQENYTFVPDQGSNQKSLLVPLLIFTVNFICVILLGLICYFLAKTVEAKRRNRRRMTGDSIFLPSHQSGKKNKVHKRKSNK